MPHAIWTGSISFGLVTIPVTLYTAKDTKAALSFHLLDGRDMSPVKQKRVNEITAEEVPWEEIVRGYELEDGRWVVLEDADFRAANVEATQTIDVLSAVCAEEIAPQYYDRPYYLQPEKPGRKAYVLLHETLKRAGRIALAKIVIRTRQHLAAIIPENDMLLLELLRYPYELRSTEDLDLPSTKLDKAGVTDAELTIAQELVDAIARSFDPGDELYRDTYRDDLLALIERKAKVGAVMTPAPEPKAAEEGAEVVDIVELLKRSLQDAKRRAEG